MLKNDLRHLNRAWHRQSKPTRSSKMRQYPPSSKPKKAWSLSSQNCKQELATKSSELDVCKDDRASLRGDVANIIDKRKRHGDATTPPAKRPRNGEDAERQEDLPEEGEIICRPEAMNKQKDGPMSQERWKEKMGGWEAQQAEIIRRQEKHKESRKGSK